MSGDGPVLSSEIVHRGRRFRVRRDVLARPGEGECVREVIEHPGAAVILATDPDGRIVLVRQYRHAVGRELLELPAGTLEPDEDPAACAARELEEETGFRAGKLTPLGIVYPSPGILSEEMHIFRAARLVPGPARPDPGERIEVELRTVDEVRRAVRSGKIRDGKTLAALALAGPDRF